MIPTKPFLLHRRLSLTRTASSGPTDVKKATTEMPAVKKRFSLAPAGKGNAVVDADEDESNAIREYKKCVEEVKNENPSLSIGAVQKVALERCAEINEGKARAEHQRARKRFSAPTEDFLRGVLSKLHLGRNGEEEDDVGPTLPSSTHVSADEFRSKKRERSMALRQRSVRISKTDQSGPSQMYWDEDGDEASLQGSLDDIECNLPKTNSTDCIGIKAPDSSAEHHGEDANPDVQAKGTNVCGADNGCEEKTRQGRRRSKRFSYRSNTDEDSCSHTGSSFLSVDSANFKGDFSAWEKPRSSMTSSLKYSLKKASAPPADLPDVGEYEETTMSSKLHPEEISVAVNDRDKVGNREEKAKSPRRGQGRGRRGTRDHHLSTNSSKCSRSSYRSNTDESQDSSFVSFDSANFAGDFSAWASFSSRSGN